MPELAPDGVSTYGTSNRVGSYQLSKQWWMLSSLCCCWNEGFEKLIIKFFMATVCVYEESDQTQGTMTRRSNTYRLPHSLLNFNVNNTSGTAEL